MSFGTESQRAQMRENGEQSYSGSLSQGSDRLAFELLCVDHLRHAPVWFSIMAAMRIKENQVHALTIFILVSIKDLLMLALLFATPYSHFRSLECKPVLMCSNLHSLSRRARDDLEHLGQPIPNGKIPEKLYGMQVIYQMCLEFLKSGPSGCFYRERFRIHFWKVDCLGL